MYKSGLLMLTLRVKQLRLPPFALNLFQPSINHLFSFFKKCFGVQVADSGVLGP